MADIRRRELTNFREKLVSALTNFALTFCTKKMFFVFFVYKTKILFYVIFVYKTKMVVFVTFNKTFIYSAISINLLVNF